LTKEDIRLRAGPYAHAKPDFLVHRPGDMERNLSCVEVKPCIRPVDELQEDLKKLTWFYRNARYYRGMFLVYGVEEHETQGLDLLTAKFHRAAEDKEIDPRYICVMHHAHSRADRRTDSAAWDCPTGEANNAIKSFCSGSFKRTKWCPGWESHPAYALKTHSYSFYAETAAADRSGRH
jgi:hypothetical protein